MLTVTTNCEDPTFLWEGNDGGGWVTVGTEASIEPEPGFDYRVTTYCGDCETIDYINQSDFGCPPTQNTPIAACVNCEINLFEYLTGGAPDTGTWTQLNGTPLVISGGHLGTVTLGPTNQVYIFRYSFTITVGSCSVDCAVNISVFAQQPPNMYVNQGATVCDNSAGFPLQSFIGNFAVGGTWSISPALPGGTLSPTTGVLIPQPGDGGTDFEDYVVSYTAGTLSQAAGCYESCSQTVNLNLRIYKYLFGGNPNPNPPHTVTICKTESWTLEDFLSPAHHQVTGSRFKFMGFHAACNGPWSSGFYAINGGAILPRTINSAPLLPTDTISGWNIGCYIFRYDPDPARPEGLCKNYGYFKIKILDCDSNPCDDVEVTIGQTGTGPVLLTAIATGFPPSCVGLLVYTWLYSLSGQNFAVIAGATTANYQATVQGFYQVIVSCEDCLGSFSTYVLISVDCEYTIDITPSGNNLVATCTNCPSTPPGSAWSWQYSTNGVTNWITVSTGSNIINPAQSGYYRAVLNYNGCVVYDEEFLFCNIVLTVNISGNQYSAAVANCIPGQTIFYQWQKFVSGSWTNCPNPDCLPNSTSQTITINAPGDYRVTVVCGDCSQTFQFDGPDGCQGSVTIARVSNNLVATRTGCSGTITYIWQYSASGFGWSTLSSTTNTQAITNGNGHYRVITLCDGACPREAIFIVSDAVTTATCSFYNDKSLALDSGYTPIRVSINIGGSWNMNGGHPNVPIYTSGPNNYGPINNFTLGSTSVTNGLLPQPYPKNGQRIATVALQNLFASNPALSAFQAIMEADFGYCGTSGYTDGYTRLVYRTDISWRILIEIMFGSTPDSNKLLYMGYDHINNRRFNYRTNGSTLFYGMAPSGFTPTAGQVQSVAKCGCTTCLRQYVDVTFGRPASITVGASCVIPVVYGTALQCDVANNPTNLAFGPILRNALIAAGDCGDPTVQFELTGSTPNCLRVIICNSSFIFGELNLFGYPPETFVQQCATPC